MRHHVLPLFALIALSACASNSVGQSASSLGSEAGAVASGTVSQTRDGLADAALSPLEDLNLRRQPIPDMLAPLKHPYLELEGYDCGHLAERIRHLDEILGPDWDAATKEDRQRSDQLASAASGAALNAIESGATGWIPFRGFVRQATGAASHQRKVTRAFTIGVQQRAYLKGYGVTLGCDLPARPDFDALKESESDDIVYK